MSTDLLEDAAQSLSQTTQTILQRNMNIQPTLRLEPGQHITFITAGHDAVTQHY